ncbi:GDP-L-fucose synthase [Nitrospinae bacterium]|nr:GDP-L-fucose synthase [Nitrospinota bacterium]
MASQKINKKDKIFIAGHLGMVGSAIVRDLLKKGYNNLLTRTREELDLLNQKAVFSFLKDEKPSYIFLAAAKVGGIHANDTFRAQFIYENLALETNIIHGAYMAGVQRLSFLGSTCIYPRNCPQPMKEEYLLTGSLEPTNEPYAISKIAGIKMCENYNRQYATQYVSSMPTNLFGINDNYDLNNSHVLPALIRKAHEAKIRSDKQLIVWGSGKPIREFLYVDDAADALIFMMENNINNGIFNIGTGAEISIRRLAEMIMNIVGFKGEIVFDVDKPDGTPRKLVSVERLKHLGWQATTKLEDGIEKTYQDFLKHRKN